MQGKKKASNAVFHDLHNSINETFIVLYLKAVTFLLLPCADNLLQTANYVFSIQAEVINFITQIPVHIFLILLQF